MKSKPISGRKSPPLLERVERTPEGLRLDLNPFLPLDPLEIKALFKTLGEQEEIVFSAFHLNLLKNIEDNSIVIRDKNVKVYNGYVIIQRQIIDSVVR